MSWCKRAAASLAVKDTGGLIAYLRGAHRLNQWRQAAGVGHSNCSFNPVNLFSRNQRRERLEREEALLPCVCRGAAAANRIAACGPRWILGWCTRDSRRAARAFSAIRSILNRGNMSQKGDRNTSKINFSFLLRNFSDNETCGKLRALGGGLLWHTSRPSFPSPPLPSLRIVAPSPPFEAAQNPTGRAAAVAWHQQCNAIHCPRQ
jgi:hypothetical protein